MKGKFSLLTIIIFFLSLETVLAVEIKATVDRNPVNTNESFQLTFTATESPDEDPDFSPLKQNFEILNQRHSTSSSWINGESSKSIQWILTVMAKTTGNINIPAIAFGDDHSQALSLVVNNQASPASNTENKELFLEVEASPKTAYVQSQVLYTVRLFRRVQMTQARLNEPEMADAIIEVLGEDKNYNTEINGVAYVVTERKYAIFPQKSGTVTIEPLVLTAEVVTNSSRSRYNSFFNRQSTTTKRVTSAAINLDIQAAPKSFSGNRWIPSEQVYLEQKWSGDIHNMKVGEPLTRTLTLLAKGTTVAQLPELHKATNSAQLKTYPDQPNLKEQKKADGMIAFREEKIAYIPSKSGSYTLPAVEVPWFNTRSKKMEIARIPEQTVNATGGTAQINNDIGQTETTPSTGENIKPEVQIQQVDNPVWKWLSIFLAIGWIMTLFLLFKNRQPKVQQLSITPEELKLKEIVKTLKNACRNNDPYSTKDALLNWGKRQYGCTNLSAIAGHCEARLRDEILLLNQNLYALESAPWSGKKLFQTFTENNARAKVAKKSNDGLEPLFKA